MFGVAPFAILLNQLFSWLPPSLWIFVWAVLAAAFLSIIIKLLSVILDWIFKFIDIFT